MENREEFYRSTVILGWIVLIHVVMLMFLVGLVRNGVANDFSPLAKDPGELGTNMLVILLSIYALMPLFIKTINSYVFRWFTFGLAIFFFLFFVAHQLNHMITDQMPLKLDHVLDFLHHGVMLFVIFLNFLWARSKS